jgi:hypothetical protein
VTNPNKVKGDAFERAVRDHACTRGFRSEKTRAGYARDAGDVHLLDEHRRPIAALQCKNVRTWDLAGWCRALAEQLAESGARHGALVLKRRGTADPGQSYVVLTLDQYLDLLTPTPDPLET